MSDATSETIGSVTPEEAWSALSAHPRAMLVDVRTRAEWAFVGTPDPSPAGRPLVLQEWVTFPAMARNPDFLEALSGDVTRHGAEALYFICRTGGRSHDAAVAAAEHFAAAGSPVACFNVVEGFEGPPDAQGHRGTVSGWKARNLPWRQS